MAQGGGPGGDAGEKKTFDAIQNEADNGLKNLKDTLAMARTTGYTCTGIASLVASGLWSEPGLAPPEVVGSNAECFDSVRAHLKKRGVLVDCRVEDIE